MSELTIEKRRIAEHDKLTEQFKNIDGRKKKIVEKLIQNAAFMSVGLEELQTAIDTNGYVSEYKNGENQYGTKKSPEIETYNQLLANYIKVVKQLTDLLPESVETSDNDLEEINEFIKQ